MAFKRKVKISGKTTTVTDRIDQIVIAFGESKKETAIRCRTAAYRNEKAMLDLEGCIPNLHVTKVSRKENENIPGEVLEAIETLKAYCYTDEQILAGAEEFDGADPIL